MKKCIAVAILALLAVILAATDAPLLGWRDYHPVALEDGGLSSLVNPAALGYGNAAGLGYLHHMYNNNNDTYLTDEDYYLILQGNGFGYTYHQIFDRVSRDKGSGHLFTAGTKVVRNLYLGHSYGWKNSGIGDGNYGASLLYRPLDMLSLGGRLDNIGGTPDSLKAQLGVAVRPLPGSSGWQDRLSLTADFNWGRYYNYDDHDYSTRFLQPTIGLMAEPIPGLQMGGSYSLEDEAIYANFALTFNELWLGSYTHVTKNSTDTGSDNRVNSYSGIFIGSKAFANLVAPLQKPAFYDYKLAGSISEQHQSFKLGPFEVFNHKGKTLRELKTELTKLKDDSTIKGIIIKNPDLAVGLTDMTEIRRCFNDFKNSGKKVVVYSEDYSNGNYALMASIADQIYLNPNGSVDLKGMGVRQPYIRELLDTLGVDFYNFRSHPFKTAGNMFSEKEMTPAEREALDYVLSGMYAEFTSMVEGGRAGKLSGPASRVIDNGPYYQASDALNAGLVDGLLYEDELEDKLNENYRPTAITTQFPLNKQRTDWADESADKVALIFAVGNISSGKSQKGRSIGSETLCEDIRKAREDQSVKAIILRVNSGGGSALASDNIAHQIKLCQNGPNRKPVVVSMGGVAASGGYYISAFANKIVAEKSTITGSIGVIGMMPNFTRLFKKIHVNWSGVKKGEHSDIGTMSRPMTPEEQELIKHSIEATYDRFISIVAEGRKMSKENVAAIAQGRIWTGEQAKERGLVDEIGGMDKAKEVTKNLLGTGRELELVAPQEQTNGIELDVNIDSPLAMLTGDLPVDMKAMKEYMEMYENFKDEKVLLIPAVPLPTLE